MSVLSVLPVVTMMTILNIVSAVHILEKKIANDQLAITCEITEVYLCVGWRIVGIISKSQRMKARSVFVGGKKHGETE